MHIIETMSACTGLKIHKPFIQTEEIDLPDRPYITFHPVHKKGTRRKYDHWVNVIENLKEYYIVQIGEKNNIKYEDYGVNIKYLEKTNMNQLAYLIKNAKLHLGYDSFPIHIASAFGVKIVGLWSQWSSHSYPFFSNPKDYIILEPDYNKIGIKPSFSDDDQHQLINYIRPEDIIESVHRLMRS